MWRCSSSSPVGHIVTSFHVDVVIILEKLLSQLYDLRADAVS